VSEMPHPLFELKCMHATRNGVPRGSGAEEEKARLSEHQTSKSTRSAAPPCTLLMQAETGAPLRTPDESEQEEEDWHCGLAHCVERHGDVREAEVAEPHVHAGGATIRYDCTVSQCVTV